MKIYLYLLLKQKHSGFTLIELLMASMMTIFVVMAAGYGTMVMLRENTAASVASDTQYNLNRASDFIVDEVKSASMVLTTFGSATGCNTGSYTPILGFTVQGQSAPIIYCIKTNTSSNEVWLGKNVIYRWGPSLAADGSYGTWPSAPQPLVDLIAETSQTTACQNTSWTKIESLNASGTPKGFFVCIEPTNRKMLEVHLNSSAFDINDAKAKTTQWMSSNTSSRYGDKAAYEVINQVFMRAPSDITLSVNSTTVSAGTGTSIVFTFGRAGVITNSLSVNFTTTGSTSKFTIPTSPVTIPANSASTTLTVTTNSATSGNTLTLAIASGTGYQVGGTSSITVTVVP